MSKKLPPKHQAFAEYYIQCGNKYEAAIKAGYSESYAKAQSYKLLDNVGIREYIDSIMNKASEKRIASAEDVLQYLTEVMLGKRKDRFGLDISIADRNRAAELLGKRHRLFTDKIEQDQNKSIKIEVKKVSDK